MKKLLFLAGLLFLIMIGSALALPVGGLNITNVKIDTVGPVACGGNIQFSATVKDTFNGSNGIIKVQFEIIDWVGNAFMVDAVLVNGTLLNGGWVYNYTLSNPVIQKVSLGEIRVENAAHVVCNAMDTSQTDSCNVIFSTPVEAVCSCNCSAVYTDDPCNIYNYKVRTISYDPACGLDSSTTQISCDFCNPLWTASMTACSAANFTTLTGTSVVTYANGVGASPNGTACCGFTSAAAGRTIFNHNGGSDCQAPPTSGVNMSCTLDSWAQYAHDGFNSGENSPANGAILSGMSELSAGNGAKDDYQPLVWDVDWDGASEIIVLSPIGLLVYSQGSSSLTLESSYLGDFTGQPALFGVEETSDGVYDCVSGFGCNMKLVVGDNTSGNADHLLIFNFSSGSINLENNISLPTISGQQITFKKYNGFACKDDKCYFIGQSNGATNYFALVEKIDVTLGSISTIYSSDWTGNTSWVDNSKVTPVLLDDRMLFWLVDDSVLALMRQISYAGASMGFYDAGGDLILGATYKDGYVYFTQQKLTGAYTTYDAVRYDVFGTLSGNRISQVWEGISPSCITPPVNAKCGGANDFVFIHYNGVPSAAATGLGWNGLSMRVDGMQRTSNAVIYPDVEDFDSYDTLTKENILTSTIISRYPLYIDSNGDGLMEYWLFADDAIYVFDQTFTLLDSIIVPLAFQRNVNDIPHFLEKPAADDMNNDGKTEVFFPFLWNYTWDYINVYRLDAAGIAITLIDSVNTSVTNWGYGYGAIESKHANINIGWDDDDLNSALFFVYGQNYVGARHTPTIQKYTMSGDSLILSATKSLNNINASDSSFDFVFEDMTGDGDTELINMWYLTDGVDGKVVVLDFDNLNVEKNFTVSLWGGSTASRLGGIYVAPVDGGANEIIFTAQRATQVAVNVYTYGGGLVRRLIHSIASSMVSYETAIIDKGDNFYLYLVVHDGGIVLGTQAVNWDLQHGNFSAQYGLHWHSINSRKGSLTTDVWNDVWYVNLDDEGTGYGPDFLNMDDGEFKNSTGINQGYSASFIDVNFDGHKDMFVIGPAGTQTLRLYLCGVAPVVTTNSWLECYDGNTMVATNKIALSGSSCDVSGSLSSTTIDPNDLGRYKWSYVLASNGIYDLWALDKVVSLTKPAIPIDLNGDLYTDFLESGIGLTKAFFSRPDVQPFVPASTVNIFRLQPCQLTSTANGNNFLSLGVWGTAPSSDISYSVNYGDSSTAQSQYPYNMFYKTYTKSGTFTVTAQMCSGILCDTETCVVSPNLTAEFTAGTAGACSLGDDGEFNWNDDIDQHAWLFSLDSSEVSLKPSGGVLTISSSPSFTVFHDASCNKDIMALEFRASVSKTANFFIDLMSGSRIIADFGFYNSGIYTYVNDTWTKVGVYNSSYVTYKMVINMQTRKFMMYVGDAEIYGGDIIAEPTNGNFWDASIMMGYDIGTINLDYIRITGSGTQIQTSLTPELIKQMQEENLDATKLDACSAYGTSYQEAKKSGFPSQSYPAMINYCTDKNVVGSSENGMCDYTDLKRAVNYNSVCWKEAMNYCVDRLYPFKTGGGIANSGEGVTVCMSVLGLGVATDKFTIPIISSFWEIVKTNMIPILLLIVTLIVIFALINKK